MAAKTTATPWVCPDCGQAYGLERALKRHQSTMHGAPLSKSALRRQRQKDAEQKEQTMPEPTGAAAEVAAQLRELTKPLREQHAQILARLNELQKESTELRAAQRQIEMVLHRLDPEPNGSKPAGRGTGSHDAKNVLKRPSVEQFLDAHADMFEDGFTLASLNGAMRNAAWKPVVGLDYLKGIIEEMHGQGILRIDGVAQGGGTLYKVVGNAP